MNTKNISKLAIMPLLAAMILLNSCSQDIDVSSAEVSKNMQAVKVRLNVSKTEFDSQESTRSGGSGTGWENDETIYLWFDGGAIKGTAVFKAASSDWDVKLTGNLSSDVTGKVEAYYFDKPVSATDYMLNMDATTGIYSASDGSYRTYANGDLDIVLTLKPITSRIRFVGNSGTDIEIEGLKYYTGYDIANHQLTVSTGRIHSTVQADGYTPYYYCESFGALPRLIISISPNNAEYFKYLSNSAALKIGESGYVTLPTVDSDVAWIRYIQQLEFTVTGNGKTIPFKMKKVEGGIFQMGSTDGSSDWAPVHTVTLPYSYYMGETEVTQGLWYAVMGQKPHSDDSWISKWGLGDNYPAYGISYEDCEKFLNKLNQIIGKNFNFRLPTEAEWEFAARGGNRSKGYIYAGSNTIDDVAWYEYNSYRKGESSPDYGMQVVKTKAANELGLYDMSGNAWEWCYDWYGNYSSSAQKNPTGPVSGSKRVIRGGSWSNPPSNCQVFSRLSSSPDNYQNAGIGLRLAMY